MARTWIYPDIDRLVGGTADFIADLAVTPVVIDAARLRQTA